MSEQQLQYESRNKDDSWNCALEVVKSALEIPTILPPLIKNSWSGLYETKDFMHGIGFPGWSPRSLMRAAEMAADGGDETPADVERAVEILGLRFSAVVLAINFVCQAALMRRPPNALWTPLFRETMTAIEVGYRFGGFAPDIGPEGGALIGFSHNAGLTLLLAYDQKRFADWRSGDAAINSRQRALELFGCEPYQVGALTLQQLGFGPEIALAAALANGALHHELIEISGTVLAWKAAFTWIEALQRGAPFPNDVEARAAFSRLLPSGPNKGLSEPLQRFHSQLADIRHKCSAWMWHLPKASYEATGEHLHASTTKAIKGKVWKTEKRQIIFEPSSR